MLINLDDIKVSKAGKSFVIGNAKDDKGLLAKNQLVFMAEGVQTFLKLVQKEYPKSAGSHSSSKVNSSFNTFGSYEDAMRIFTKDPSSIVKFDEGEMKPKDFNEQGRDLEYDVTGDFIDMGRHVEGVPESFGSLHNGNPRSRRIRIIVNTNGSGSMSESLFRERGERIVRLVDSLEKTNVRVELSAISCNECLYSQCLVKGFNESLVLEDVAVAMHPEFLRRVLFRINEHSPTHESGYGSSAHLHGKVDQFSSKLNDELTILILSNLDDVDELFDALETRLEEELSEPQPTLQLLEVTPYRINEYSL